MSRITLCSVIGYGKITHEHQRQTGDNMKQTMTSNKGLSYHVNIF